MNDETKASSDLDSESMARLLVESFPPVEPDAGVWNRIQAQIAETPEAKAEIPAPPVRDELAERRRNRIWPMLLGAAAVFLAVIGTIAVVGGGDGGSDTIAAGVTRELIDPGTGEVTAIVTTAEDGSSIIDSVALEVLDASSTYQLWSVVGDEIVSVGLLGSDPSDVPLRIEGDPAVLAITVEVSGGVAVSAVDPVAVWQASA